MAIHFIAACAAVLPPSARVSSVMRWRRLDWRVCSLAMTRAA